MCGHAYLQFMKPESVWWTDLIWAYLINYAETPKICIFRQTRCLTFAVWPTDNAEALVGIMGHS